LTLPNTLKTANVVPNQNINSTNAKTVAIKANPAAPTQIDKNLLSPEA